jgi:nucleoside-diphosphate-sugar epimerase
MKAMRGPRLQWLGLLSTIGVYGDHGGGWVDEETAPAPQSERSKWRLAQERQWLALAVEASMTAEANTAEEDANAGDKHAIKPHIFRLPGIYGPGRNPLLKLRSGKARRIVKEGQFFNRIHVDDLARALLASMEKPQAGYLFNLCDDEPAPPDEVLLYASSLLGMEPPPAIDFAAAKLSPMTASFYGESKRASNRRMKDKLGLRLLYPTYREGLAALLDGLA